MKFIADLHIHSRFSRATSKTLDLRNLESAARVKGITVLGTGDATHPEWIAEIRKHLEPSGPGLFRIRIDDGSSTQNPVRFILQSEISCIYKKQGKTRKSHHLVFFPDLEGQERFNRKLSRIGKIHSDGRPILGLDARHLLEIVLESSEDGVLIPAHIWTPWFSVLGSKSGFDNIEECFEDLTHHVFAVETGLSSDPPMNRRVSGLDALTLISNSDAHSAAKLGREANLFDTDLSYTGIFEAIRSADPIRFLGTIEFFPEEGKYHLDGHRRCGVRSLPEETRSTAGRCPLCGKSMTLGVLYRVEELADRSEGLLCSKMLPFQRLIPLTDILSEVFACGPGSLKVGRAYRKLISCFGSELAILREVDPEAVASADIPLLAEAIRRMRDGRVSIAPGYDGVFGDIRIFSPAERDRFSGRSTLLP